MSSFLIFICDFSAQLNCVHKSPAHDSELSVYFTLGCLLTIIFNSLKSTSINQIQGWSSTRPNTLIYQSVNSLLVTISNNLMLEPNEWIKVHAYMFQILQ